MFPIASDKGSSSCIRNYTHYGYDWCRIKSIIGFSLITFSVQFWIKMMVFMRYCQKSTIGTLKCKVLIGSPWAECPVSSSRGLSVNENVQPWPRNWRMLAGAGQGHNSNTLGLTSQSPCCMSFRNFIFD